MAERIKHKTIIHPEIDLTKPVPVETLIKEATEEGCYTYLWKPGHTMCNLCASLEMCGILYNARLTKKVKKLEKEKGGYLDSMLFDCINKDELKQWLQIKPRTTQELVDKVGKFANCPDPNTTMFWCKSFIIETPGISTKDGIVIVK